MSKDALELCPECGDETTMLHGYRQCRCGWREKAEEEAMEIEDITADEGIGKLLAENRWCFYVDASSKTNRGFIPSVVIEGQPGHYPMLGKGEHGEHAEPWYWGDTYKQAEATCKRMNAERGLTDEDVDEIVTSSMFAKAKAH